MRVLVISYFFPPAAPVGVVRISKLVKYWSRTGVDVTVLRGDDLLGATGVGAADQSCTRVVKATSFVAPETVAVVRQWLKRADAPGARARGHVLRRSRPIVAGAARQLRDHVLVPDMGILWMPAALRAAARLHREQPFQVVFSSGNPWSNLLIARAIATRFRLPFVVDFRDPWGDGPLYTGRAGWTRLQRMAHTRLEELVCRDAVFVSATTQKIADAIAARCSLRNPPQVIENGFDPEDPVSSVVPGAEPSTFRIVMTSSFRAGSRFADFVHALRRLVDRIPEERRRVRFVFAGRSHAPGEAMSLKDYFQDAGLLDLLEDRGFLPRPDALALQRSADLLLFVETPFKSVPGGMVGTEFYEYMSTGRRILLLDDADSAVWQVGARSGIVRRCDQQDVSEIETALSEAISRKWEPRPDWAWIGNFSRQKQAERFVRLLEKATELGART